MDCVYDLERRRGCKIDLVALYASALPWSGTGCVRTQKESDSKMMVVCNKIHPATCAVWVTRPLDNSHVCHQEGFVAFIARRDQQTRSLFRHPQRKAPS